MAARELETHIQKILEPSGVVLNGPNRWDPQIKNPATYGAVISKRNLGFGESYMKGWWECEQLDEMFFRILSARLGDDFKPTPQLMLAGAGLGIELAVTQLKQRVLNPQRREKAFEVGKRHYDINNSFFEAMLGETMAYSCAYWETGATNLDRAQSAKIHLVAEKLDIQPGDHVLDIGCGWGSFAKVAAAEYGATVVGVTVSEEQKKFIDETKGDLPITVRAQDYRELDIECDKIVSIGMFEHVGYKNYREYMQVANRCLKPDGLMLLHTIVAPKTEMRTDPFLEKYIFPNGYIPSLEQIARAADGIFVTQDVHNIGPNYDPTLMAWHQNFKDNWSRFESDFEPNSQEFYRMWEYYLMCCAGSFRAGNSAVDQIVFSKYGATPNGYRSVR